MPNLAQLVREGTSGILETIRPPLSPLIWTSMMTGVSPLDHGILDFVQFDPKTGAKEPITSSLRRAPAIWNMASSAGKRVASLGLWATYPAEPVNGTIVSDRLFTFLFKEAAPPAGVVSPADREQWARDALAHAEQTVGESALQAYLPWLSHADYERYADSDDPYSQPVSALRRILIDTQRLRRAGSRRPRARSSGSGDCLLRGHRHDRPRLRAVRAAAPAAGLAGRLRSLSRRAGALLQAARRASRRISPSRRELARRADARLRPRVPLEGRPPDDALEQRDDDGGEVAPQRRDVRAVGRPGVTPSTGHTGRGSVQQVCATLLALLGLPQGRDVDGPPLPGVAAPTCRARRLLREVHPAAAPAPSDARSIATRWRS